MKCFQEAFWKEQHKGQQGWIWGAKFRENDILSNHLQMDSVQADCKWSREDTGVISRIGISCCGWNHSILQRRLKNSLYFLQVQTWIYYLTGVLTRFRLMSLSQKSKGELNSHILMLEKQHTIWNKWLEIELFIQIPICPYLTMRPHKIYLNFIKSQFAYL